MAVVKGLISRELIEKFLIKVIRSDENYGIAGIYPDDVKGEIVSMDFEIEITNSSIIIRELSIHMDTLPCVYSDEEIKINQFKLMSFIWEELSE